MYIVVSKNRGGIITAITVKAASLLEAAQKYEKVFPMDIILSITVSCENKETAGLT